MLSVSVIYLIVLVSMFVVVSILFLQLYIFFSELKRRKNAGETLGYFNEWQLICIVGCIWSAGIETTLTTLLWGILLMMYHTEVQEKVKEEIKRVIGFNRFPTMDDRQHMPYTIAVIQEVQRFANIVPNNFPRTVNRDTQIGNYKIPKGTTILPQISVVLFDEENFKDPQSFNPERFIEESGETLKKSDRFIPFSLGKRTCLGEGLARMELFLIFSTLMQHFSFLFVENEPRPSLKPITGMTVSPESFNVKICRHI